VVVVVVVVVAIVVVVVLTVGNKVARVVVGTVVAIKH